MHLRTSLLGSFNPAPHVLEVPKAAKRSDSTPVLDTMLVAFPTVVLGSTQGPVRRRRSSLAPFGVWYKQSVDSKTTTATPVHRWKAVISCLKISFLCVEWFSSYVWWSVSDDSTCHSVMFIRRVLESPVTIISLSDNGKVSIPVAEKNQKYSHCVIVSLQNNGGQTNATNSECRNAKMELSRRAKPPILAVQICYEGITLTRCTCLCAHRNNCRGCRQHP